jgi:hypothetical protein
MIKRLFALFSITISLSSFAHENQWVWVRGDTINDQAPIFGEQGIPDPISTPVGNYNSVGWVDGDGMFWLFGGQGYHGMRGALWRLNPETLEWTWMKGSSTENYEGSYGEMGVASETNNPPSRGWGFAHWTDNDGNLWLYGGADSETRYLTDMWKYDVDTNMWTWMSGSQIATEGAVLPVYGMPGIPSSNLTPGSRAEVAGRWVDQDGNLWLFGGQSLEGSSLATYNDLWKYDTELNQWAYIRGQTTINPPSVYGVQGISDLENEPSGRMAHGFWTDDDGNFWMMGGKERQNLENQNWSFNDLWRYNPGSNEWTWMSGSTESGDAGYYGIKGQPNPLNCPPNRFENRANWSESNKLFMFGGVYQGVDPAQQLLNDLWVYDISANTWTWIAGDTLGQDPAPAHGTMGIPSPQNTPGGRYGALAWYAGDCEAYLFSGRELTQTAPTTLRLSSEVWKFIMDPQYCLLSNNEIINPAIFQAYPNPASNYVNIRLSNDKTQNLTITFTNTFGAVVHQENVGRVAEHFLLDIPAFLTNGIYIITLESESNRFSQKLSVIR